MLNKLNETYMVLCAEHGVNLHICTTDAPNISRYKIAGENEHFTLSVNANVPAYLGYKKVLAWGVREVLLPRLTLKTERLILRRFTENDKENCLPFLSNKQDCYMDCCRNFMIKDEDYYQRVALFIERETQYAVTLKESGELIGTIHIFPDTARAVDTMEIGYCIAHEHQRKGYATEMLTAILQLLQNDLLVDTISAGTLPENNASICLLERLGFQAEGIRHHAVWHETLDQPVDLQYFYHDKER